MLLPPPNRVKVVYEVAVDFLSLPPAARFLIAAHYQIFQESFDLINREAMDERIFTEVFKRGIFEEFKRFTAHYKKSRSHEYMSV